ncbi:MULTISPECIES: BF3164 family lipoprotein [unclassified Parabacteroides]|uniref:BF3164 family lipoprotein n=1 Tax=unclassified Parabacteroides TaxID=2649774 RepID=UPI002477238F|nr:MULTISPECIES: BF3164 family lipoprotein [unclassified Parabacteroides]
MKERIIKRIGQSLFSLILLLSGVLFTSCVSSGIHFPLEETITPELMPLQGVTSPFRVEVKQPFLLIQNGLNQRDSLFHVYDLTSYELKHAFGRVGEGPDEFVGPWMYYSSLSDLLIGDYGKEQVFRYSLDEAGMPTLKGSRRPLFEYGTSNAAFINDSLYVMDAMFAAPSLYLLGFDDASPKKSWPYRDPNLLDYYSDPNAGNVYANENRIVLCYEFKKQIDFFDTELNLLHSVVFDYERPADTTNDGDVKTSYAYGYIGKRYFYALFFGVSWNDHRNIYDSCGTILEVFDMDGNPVARYRLDGRRPSGFAVDEETFTLYSVGADGEPEDYLLVYKLKGLSPLF